MMLNVCERCGAKEPLFNQRWHLPALDGISEPQWAKVCKACWFREDQLPGLEIKFSLLQGSDICGRCGMDQVTTFDRTYFGQIYQVCSVCYQLPPPQLI